MTRTTPSTVCRVSVSTSSLSPPLLPRPSPLVCCPLVHCSLIASLLGLTSLTPDYADHPITGRAHLLDIPRHLAQTGAPALTPLQRCAIPASTLKACAEAEGLEFAPGDILIVRTGLTEAMAALSKDEYEAVIAAAKGYVGVEASEETWRWHWESGFAAVATDT